MVVLGQCTATATPAAHTMCAGGPVQLVATGSNGTGPYSFSWAPPAGLSSTNISNPVCTATSSTTYTVTVTDQVGATCTANVQVNILPTATAILSSGNALFTTFNGFPTFYRCTVNPTAAFNFDFGGTALAGSQHSINWGDGSPNFNITGATWSGEQHIYSAGIHTLTYSITQPNGCNDTRSYSVFVGSNPAGGIINPGNTNGCGPLALNFPLQGWENNTPGTIYIITLNDGTPPITFNHPPPAIFSHIFSVGSCGTTSTDGTNTYAHSFSVNLRVENPCGSSGGGVVPINVGLAGAAGFNIAPGDTACVNTVVQFASTSTGNEIQGNACDETPPLLWTIVPATGWTISSGVVGNSFGFVGPTYDPGSWTSGSQNLNVNFTTPGTYSVQLVAGNACGSDTLTRSVCIEGPPQPAFTLAPNSGCAPFTSIVDNTSSSPNSCRTTYAWDVSTAGGSCGSGPAWNYSGGTNATSTEPQFQFTQAGTYSIRLQATNSCGTFQQVQVATANAPPQVDVADLTGICATQCVDPSAVVQDCGSSITTYAWTFAGGTPANANTLDPPQVCYASATSSLVSLTVTNACGSATDVTTLAVGALPAAPVISTNSPVCAGQILSLSANTVPGLNYHWIGPNGFTSDQPSFTITGVTAAHAGTYTLVAISSGCQGPSSSVIVQVIPAPTLTVTPSSDQICNGETATFTVSGASNYQWFIGSTVVGTGHLFNTSPAISTTYTVTGDLGGCPGSATVPVTVFPITGVNAGADRTECDQTIPVSLNSFPTPGVWSGPNVTPAGVFTPVPDQLGPVTLTYTHVDGNGCTNSDQMVITVNDLVLIAHAGNDTSFCQRNTPVSLPASPAGGTWSGDVSAGQFTPNTAGTFLGTYSYGTGTCATSDQVNILVLAAPALNLPASFTRCIDAAAVPLGGTPLGGTWSGAGVGGAPFVFDPLVAGQGTHVLSYTFIDGAGCSSTGTIQATVNPLPVVNAGSDLQLCDQPIPFPLSATPSGGTWSATTMNVTPGGEITPAGVGTDVLTYSYSDGAGCSGSDQITVTVVAITEPAFAGNDTAVCINSGDLALIGSPFGGTWGGPGVSVAGVFSTASAGTFTLTYSFGTATCLIQDQVTVVVHALPVVDAGEAIAICLDGGMQVLSATPPGGTWSGVGVDAAGNFDPLLAVSGGNPVTYSYTDPLTGCSNSDATMVTVNPLPTPAMDHAPVACANVAFPFTNNSTGASNYEWDFGDGTGSFSTNPQHIYTATGNYNIRLIAITGANCRDTTYSTVDVWDVPTAAFVLSADTGCGPLEVGFTNNSTGEGLAYAWEFGGFSGSADEDPAPFTFPPDPLDVVNYEVSLTVSNVCGQVVATMPLTVLPVPTAVFGPNLNAYCSFAEVPFGNASYGAPTSFQWLFGDGQESTDPGPVVTHSYDAGETDPLPITVALIASNMCGSDTAYQQITILPNQVNAFFNADPVQGCSPVTVNLTQFSTGDATFYWDLGDGNVSEQHDLSWTYTEPGEYTIELFAYGCGFDSYTTQVTVFAGPDIDFTFSPPTACAGEPFQFTGSIPGVSGLSWDFDDGGSSTLTNPVHTFDGSGTFNVALTATAISNGCTTTVTHPVPVRATPQASFVPSPASGCIDLDVAFDNTTVGGDFSQWNFGDGNTSGATDPFHTYTAAGTYIIRLISESLNGCSDTAFAEVVAHPLPNAVFSLSQAESCGPETTVQTINNSQGAIGYSWDLGNGTTSDLNQPAVTFTEPGSYTISLTATNQFGCQDLETATFVQHPTPEAAFYTEPEPGCAGYPIDFINTSTNGITYAWEFGDGSSSNTDFPLHTYDEPGAYDVRLIVHGAGGCSDTLVALAGVNVRERPTAAFAYDTLQTIAHALHFRNESEGAVSYSWDFDDGETSTARHPLHVFPADGGGFTICLVAMNSVGCPDTVCTAINVPGDPHIFVPNSFTPNNDTRNDTFRPILNGFVGWNYRFIVFDRWGLPVFETRDRATPWDGTRNGTGSPVDVYVWKVIVERDGDARDFVGHVSLIR